ncbi:hypothetical protein RAD15_42570 [Bradyrhizobium sp. 14AA]
MSILNPEGRRQYCRRLFQGEADEGWAALSGDWRLRHGRSLACDEPAHLAWPSRAGGASMHDWKSELDALVAETMAFAKSLKVEIERPRPQPKEVDERDGLSVPDYGASERDEIRKRVESFKAHQERFMCEREEYADSLLRRIRPIT